MVNWHQTCQWHCCEYTRLRSITVSQIQTITRVIVMSDKNLVRSNWRSLIEWSNPRYPNVCVFKDRGWRIWFRWLLRCQYCNACGEGTISKGISRLYLERVSCTRCEWYGTIGQASYVRLDSSVNITSTAIERYSIVDYRSATIVRSIGPTETNLITFSLCWNVLKWNWSIWDSQNSAACTSWRQCRCTLDVFSRNSCINISSPF